MNLAVALLALSVGAQAPAPPAPSRVPQREFKRLAAAQKILIVDVRSPREFADGHIPRAISIPFSGSQWSDEYDPAVAMLKASAKPVVLYCACHGDVLSVQAANSLLAEGVKDARVLAGGWNDWVNDGNRVAKGTK